MVPFNPANKFGKERIKPALETALKDIMENFNQTQPLLYSTLKVSFIYSTDKC